MRICATEFEIYCPETKDLLATIKQEDACAAMVTIKTCVNAGSWLALSVAIQKALDEMDFSGE